MAIGAVIGGAFEIGSQLIANGGNLKDIHWGKVAVATAVGGITAITGATLGAAISGVGNGIMERMSGIKSELKIVTSIVVGAGASLVGSGIGKIVEIVGGKMAVKSLAKKSPGVIKKTVLSKINVKSAHRNAIKDLSWAVSNYKELPSALLGRSIPQVFNSLGVGISGYGTMGAIYGFK
ncbi:MAG: hypothetical protein PUB22_09300 [Clostridiales bacterium]|nr:hypothetical protein [Clostridiales bacterium]